MSEKRQITSDLLLYFAGMAVPMLVLFLRMPIYTRVFSTEMFGQFAIVNVTFTYFSAIAFRTLMNIGSRFYHRFKQEKRIDDYYRSYYQTALAAVILLLSISLIWCGLANDDFTRTLILWGMLHFIFQELLNTLTLPLRQEKKAVLVNTTRIISALVSFALLLTLTFLFELSIEAFYICTIGVNVVILLYLIFAQKLYFPSKLFTFCKQDLKEFMHFGFSDVSLSIGVMLIMNSDRYLIDLYGSKSDVGAYSLIYNLGQMLVITMVTLYQTATNPHLFELIEKSKANVIEHIPRFLYPAMYLYIPVSLIGFFFAKELSLILGPDFRELYFILPWVVGANLLYGLTHFFLVPLKFTGRYFIIIKGSLLAALVNIAFNLYFIPRYGVRAAAWSTLLAYLLLFVVYVWKSHIHFTNFRLQSHLWIRLFISIGFIAGVYITYNIFLSMHYPLAAIPVVLSMAGIYLLFNPPKKAISLLNESHEH